eukprot:733217-Pyramimonas_sp.AAC.1
MAMVSQIAAPHGVVRSRVNCGEYPLGWPSPSRRARWEARGPVSQPVLRGTVGIPFCGELRCRMGPRRLTIVLRDGGGLAGRSVGGFGWWCGAGRRHSCERSVARHPAWIHSAGATPRLQNDPGRVFLQPLRDHLGPLYRGVGALPEGFHSGESEVTRERAPYPSLLSRALWGPIREPYGFHSGESEVTRERARGLPITALEGPLEPSSGAVPRSS